jgi:zinc and cadmium transporter
MQLYVILAAYCFLIMAGSVAGGLLPWLVKLTHRRMQFVMSFVGGLMLGVALLHLLPHAIAQGASIDTVAWWCLGGLLAMFLLIRVFHVHAHEHGEAAEQNDESHDHHHHHHGHEHCDHDHGPHDHSHAHPPSLTAERNFSWVGLAFGLALHTIIDGLALGAAVAAEAEEAEHGWALFGVGTFLAVALHKPLDALSITSLMASGGWSRRAALVANIGFALMCPLGAIGFVFGLGKITGGSQGIVIGCALAFAAGVFLCISLADLLPEVTFHSHDQFWLTTALLLGVGLAILIGFFEHKHVHGGHPNHSHEHTRHAEH